ncbi:MAG: Plug domain-containing protein, partial [Bacteroidales bacterium]|nr:Plug domain-containing protein [Bacteroidales bacterium]
MKLFYPKLGKHKLSCLLIFFAGIIGNQETDLFAQSSDDSLTELPIVDIIASRLDEYTIGLNHEQIDSLSLTYYRTSSLASVLGDLTPIFIKSYGVGSLSTISFRGTAAHHSGVYWNGFNLNPANIGMSDLSLFPLAFFESVEILYGGASSLYGSGNIGGGLHLKNSPVFCKMKKFDVELAYGS